VVDSVNGDSRTCCSSDGRFECGYGVFEVKCGVNGKVKVKGSSEQRPICLEIIVSYSRVGGGWVEEDFERYGVVIGVKCRDCFWLG